MKSSNFFTALFLISFLNVSFSQISSSDFSFIKSDISCHGEDDGSIQVLPLNEQETYSYLWSTGETTTSIFNLTEGKYSVQILNGNEVLIENFNIIEPEKINIDVKPINVNCNSGNNGEYIIYLNGGVKPFNFQYEYNGEILELNDIYEDSLVYPVQASDFEGFQPIQSTNVIDANGCSASFSRNISIDCFTYDISPISCALNDGEISIQTQFIEVENADTINSNMTCFPIPDNLPSCDIFISGDNTNINLNNGETACIENGLYFEGNININDGRLVVLGSADVNLTINNGTVLNVGLLQLQNANLNPNSSLINYAEISFENDFALNGTLMNYAKVNFLKGLNVNSLSSIHNLCEITVDQNLIYGNDSELINYGKVEVKGETTINSGATLQFKELSSFKTKTLSLDGTISGTSMDCSSLVIENHLKLNSNAVIDGNVEICNLSNEYENYGAVANETTFGCSCGKKESESYPKITWSNGETTPTITDLTAGTYIATLEDQFGYTNIKKFYILEPICNFLYSSPIASDTSEAKTPIVYPNPFQDEVNIDLSPDELNDDFTGYKIVSSFGEFIYENSSSNHSTWDGYNTRGEKVPTGIYIVIFKSESGKTVTQKIFKNY